MNLEADVIPTKCLALGGAEPSRREYERDRIVSPFSNKF